MRSRSEPMNDRDLAAIVERQISESILYEDSELAQVREKALQYFNSHETLGGDVPVRLGADGKPNRSRVVSSDVSDVHGWIMPSLLRVFLGSDRVVVYEPRRQDAEEAASQATDYINYLFLTECNGYAVLHSAIWDGLNFGNGIIKHWWDDTPEYSVEKLTNLPEVKFLELVSGDDIEEVIEHSAKLDPAFEAEGSSDVATSPTLHDIKVKRRIRNGCLKVVAIPSERFRIDPEATQLDEQHVRFCAHVEDRTRSALIADGYKRSVVDDLPTNTTVMSATQVARGGRPGYDNAPDHSTELIEIWECYIQVDYDGDGIAERRRVVTARGQTERAILANEEWSGDLPFTDLVPDPQPHRWRGRTLYEKVGDIQRLKTVFWRGINDNLYWINNPQREADKTAIDPSSVDEVLNPTFGGTVFVNRTGSVREMPIPFVADKLLSGMDLADRVREFRTGVSSATMSLDPEALQNQTAAAVNATKTAAYSIIETYARNIAEYGGLKRLFGCLLKLVVENQDQPKTIRLRGKWVDMDPQSWDAQMDVVVNVGLGSGSRDRDLAMLNTISAKQELVVQALGPIVAAQLGLGPDKLFETYRKMVEAAGLKSPETYFPEITPDDVARVAQQTSAQPDPKVAEAQAKIEAMKAESEAKLQLERELMALQEQARQQQAAMDWKAKRDQSDIDNFYREKEIAAKAAAELEEIRLKYQAAEIQAQREFELKQRELASQAALKVRELELEAELKREAMAMHPQTPANIPQAE